MPPAKVVANRAGVVGRRLRPDTGRATLAPEAGQVTIVPGLDEPTVERAGRCHPRLVGDHERAELVVRLLADHQPVDSALQGGEADQVPPACEPVMDRRPAGRMPRGQVGEVGRERGIEQGNLRCIDQNDTGLVPQSSPTSRAFWCYFVLFDDTYPQRRAAANSPENQAISMDCAWRSLRDSNPCFSLERATS